MDDSNGRASGTTGLSPKDRRGGGAHTATDDRYKWVALSNTTLGIFMATLDSSIVIISLPAIFRGIKLDPLVPANIGYLLWMLMGYLVVTAVLVVTLGRIGDIFGRVKMYNLGFAIFTLASAALSLTPWHGPAGAMWLIVGRVIQGIGGALLMANSTAILTDAFPVQERGMAMGINMIAAILGSFIGLVVGGLLADIQWRAVFWINVPFGVFGTIWAYRRLRDMGERNPSRIDWWGNLTFGVGLVAVLVMVATFSTLVGSILTSPRIFFTMADDGLLFRQVARVHPRFQTPSVSIVVAAALGVVWVLLLNFDQLADQFVVAIFPFYALAAAAVFTLRRRQPARPRPVQVLGYPVVPLLFILATFLILGNALREHPGSTGLAFGGILLGVPVYFAWLRWRPAPPSPTSTH